MSNRLFKTFPYRKMKSLDLISKKTTNPWFHSDETITPMTFGWFDKKNRVLRVETYASKYEQNDSVYILAYEQSGWSYMTPVVMKETSVFFGLIPCRKIIYEGESETLLRANRYTKYELEHWYLKTLSKYLEIKASWR